MLWLSKSNVRRLAVRWFVQGIKWSNMPPGVWIPALWLPAASVYRGFSSLRLDASFAIAPSNRKGKVLIAATVWRSFLPAFTETNEVICTFLAQKCLWENGLIWSGLERGRLDNIHRDCFKLIRTQIRYGLNGLSWSLSGTIWKEFGKSFYFIFKIFKFRHLLRMSKNIAISFMKLKPLFSSMSLLTPANCKPNYCILF